MTRIALILLLATQLHAQSLPEDVRKATETHEKEVNKLKLAYTQKLDQLLAKYRTAGDTATVKAIEGMIAEAEGKVDPTVKNDAIPVGEETTRWAWGSGGDLTLQGNGKAKHSSWAKSGTWQRGADQTLILVSDAGVAFEIKFDANGIGKVRSVAGDSTTTIVRKK